MPKNLPPDDESLYASGEAPEGAEAPEETGESPEGEETPESIDEENAEGSTAIVDKKVLCPSGGSLKEGDEVTLTVVKCYGEECEIRCAKKKSGGEVQPPGGMMDESNAELDMMNQ